MKTQKDTTTSEKIDDTELDVQPKKGKIIARFHPGNEERTKLYWQSNESMECRICRAEMQNVEHNNCVPKLWNTSQDTRC